MLMEISIVNGPNLNLLGKREPAIYGSEGFENFLASLKKKYPDHQITYYQSNIEGELIDHLQSAGSSANGIVLNPGAYAHTSIALADCIAAIDCPVVEVHISNIYSREPFRHHSYTAPKSVGVISGLGLKGYDLAVQFLIDQE